MRFLLLLVSTWILIGTVVPLSAQTLNVVTPTSPITYDLDELSKSFTIKQIETVSTWTGDKLVLYRGLPLSEILEKHGLAGDFIELAAENGYTSKIPRSMIEKYQPIIAFEADGAALDFSSRGPLSLIWPRSDHPDDLGETIDGMWTWYVNEIRSLN